jgi:transposase
LRELPSVQILRQVWIQQYYQEEETLYLRTRKQYGLPASKDLIQSPYDPEARNRTKRSTNWTGYACHLTETCDKETPNVVTHVETTPATTADGLMTQDIQADLADKGLLPREHLVDMAYADAENLLAAQKAQIDLVAPLPPNPSWQAQDEDAYDLTCFFIDWDSKKVFCPFGKQSISWKPHKTRQDTDMIAVTFSRTDCMPCSQRHRCTRAKNTARGLTFRPQDQFLALETARQRQETDAFREQYKPRAGVEGTISQAVRSFGLRRSRYVGLAKTHFQHIATAAAINLTRVAAWLDDTPKATTRQSRFALLALT